MTDQPPDKKPPLTLLRWFFATVGALFMLFGGGGGTIMLVAIVTFAWPLAFLMYAGAALLIGWLISRRGWVAQLSSLQRRVSRDAGVRGRVHR